MAEFTAEPPPEELKDEDLDGEDGDTRIGARGCVCGGGSSGDGRLMLVCGGCLSGRTGTHAQAYVWLFGGGVGGVCVGVCVCGGVWGGVVCWGGGCGHTPRYACV